MRFIQIIKKKIQERNATCDELIVRIDEALREIKSKFSDPQVFVDPHEATACPDRHA